MNFYYISYLKSCLNILILVLNLKVVQDEGGMDLITKERRWSRVANRMQYPSGRSVGAILKHHYERILYPFDVFHSGNALQPVVSLN